MPEEDSSKYFMVSLIIQQLYREILAVVSKKVFLNLSANGTQELIAFSLCFILHLPLRLKRQ